MEEQAFINQCRNMLDHAQESMFAGDTARSQARLEELRDLLNLQHADKSAEDEKLEQTLDTSEG